MTLRSINSNIEGHPTPDHPFVDVATGSLGQGLGVACGMAYSSKYFEKIENRYYCLMGDAEI
jgi:transketolase